MLNSKLQIITAVLLLQVTLSMNQGKYSNHCLLAPSVGYGAVAVKGQECSLIHVIMIICKLDNNRLLHRKNYSVTVTLFGVNIVAVTMTMPQCSLQIE